MTIPGMISVIIPSRNEQFLYKTVQDLLVKAKGPIEIIVVLDGYWLPPEEIINDKRVIYLHHGEPRGMRACINEGANIAHGEYLMKSDGHCMYDEGFDVKLKAGVSVYESGVINTLKDDMNRDNWIVIPRRHRLDAENWALQEVYKPPVDYEYLSSFDDLGVKGNVWNDRTKERMDKPEYMIDENMSFQGSCWFMTRHHYLERLGGMSEVGYGTFVREAQEIGLKTWLGGGKVYVNKHTFYAHLHKGKTYGRGYFIDKFKMIAGNKYCDDYWYNNRWEGAIHDFAWLIERFAPVPTWTPELIDKVRKVKQEPVETPSVLEEIHKAYPGLDLAGDVVEIPDADRVSFARFLGLMKFKEGAEIGTLKGEYAEVLCENIPGLKLHCVDPYVSYSGYREHREQGELSGYEAEARKRLEKYDARFIKEFSVPASDQVKRNSLDFVYIDANHAFRHVVDDIDSWFSKVKHGGIIAGHDYIKHKHSAGLHVVQAVHAFCESYEIKPIFVLGRKNATEPGEKRDRFRSWFFIKP